MIQALGAALLLACSGPRPTLTARSQAPEYSGKWANEPVADERPVGGPYEHARVEGSELVLRGAPTVAGTRVEQRVAWNTSGVFELGQNVGTWLSYDGSFEVPLSGVPEARAHVVGGVVLCVEVRHPQARTAQLRFRRVPASIAAEPGNAELAGLAKGLVD